MLIKPMKPFADLISFPSLLLLLLLLLIIILYQRDLVPDYEDLHIIYIS